MKRKVIIISASIFILASIIGIGIYAQSGSKSTTTSTEQTDKCVPEHCKKCPEMSKCMGEKSQQTDSTSCKSKCEGMKSCEKSTACPHHKCQGEKSSCCEKQGETKDCKKSSECQKECSNK